MATPPPHDGMDSGSPPRSPEFDLSLFDSCELHRRPTVSVFTTACPPSPAHRVTLTSTLAAAGTSHSVTPPFSPHRPTSRLGGGQHESFLRLRGVPGTPKTLLHRKRILMDDDGDASGGRPSTAPELGRPPERRTNKNPFQTQSASKPKRLALDSSAPPVSDLPWHEGGGNISDCSSFSWIVTVWQSSGAGSDGFLSRRSDQSWRPTRLERSAPDPTRSSPYRRRTPHPAGPHLQRLAQPTSPG